MTLLQISPAVRPVENYSSPWLSGILLACVVLIALVNVMSRERIMRLLASVVNIRALQEWFRDQQEALQGGAYLLVLVYILSTASLFYLLDQVYSGLIGGLGFLSCIGIVAGVFFLKNLVLLGLQDVVNGRVGLLIYRFEYVVIAQVQGLALLPVVILAVYIGKGTAPIVAGIGLGVVLAFYLFRMVRGVAHALRLRVPLFYIIFYLCALEFLPLAVLVSVVLR